MDKNNPNDTGYHKPTLEWFFGYIIEKLISRYSNPEEAFENINFTARSFIKVIQKVTLSALGTAKGSHCVKMGNVLNGHGFVLLLHLIGSDDPYWTWRWNLYDPFDIHILELCHDRWFKDHKPITAKGPCSYRTFAPALVNGQKQQLQVYSASWNRVLAMNIEREEAGLSPLLPQPTRPLTTMALIFQLLDDLGLEMKVVCPETICKVPALPTSGDVVSRDMKVIVGTGHGLDQLNDIMMHPYFYPIRYGDKRSAALVKGLASNPTHLMLYDRSNRSRHKDDRRFFLFEVELLPQTFSADELRRAFGHRSKSGTTDYRVLRIKAISTAFEFSHLGDIYNLVQGSDEVQVFTFGDLCDAGLGQIRGGGQQMAADGDGL